MKQNSFSQILLMYSEMTFLVNINTWYVAIQVKEKLTEFCDSTKWWLQEKNHVSFELT